MPAKPEISVVMPVYNAAEYVEAAVGSILAQSHKDFEFVIVDDGSGDGTVAAIRRFTDPRISLFRHSVNLGYPEAMRTGLAAARGRYMARMDADDWAAPRRLEAQFRFLEGHRDFVLAGTERFWITPNGQPFYRETVPDTGWYEETWQDFYSGNRKFTDSSAMARMEAVVRAGGYRTYSRSGQDVDLWLRLLEGGGRAAVLRGPLYGRRLLLDAITFSRDTTAVNRIPRLLADERKAAGSDRVMRGEGIADLITSEMRRDSTEWRVRALWSVAQLCWQAGDRAAALQFAARAARAGRLRLSSLRAAGRCIVSLIRNPAGGRISFGTPSPWAQAARVARGVQ